MKSPLLIFCLGPSRVPFLHPAAWVLSSLPAQSAVRVPLRVSLWVPSAFPTGPSGADLLAHPTVAVPPGFSRLSHGRSPSSSRFVNTIALSCLVVPLLSRGISRSPPRPAFPISLRVPSLTRNRSSLLTPPSLSPSRSSHSPRSLSGSPPHSPSWSFPVPRRTGRTASNSAPGMLAAAEPGLRLSLWRPRSHLSAVTRGLGAAASSHSCSESLPCWVFARWVPTRSLRPRVPVAPHSPRRTLGCRRCCCPRCGSARGDQSHPTARSAPRPHSTPPSTPPTAML